MKLMNLLTKLKSYLFIYLFILGLNYINCGSIHVLNFTNVILFIIMVYLAKLIKLKFKVIDYIFSLIFSVFTIVGREIYEFHDFHNIIDKPFTYIIIVISVICTFLLFLLVLKELINKSKIKIKISLNKKTHIIMICSFILVYFICYFAYFPGLAVYDFSYQDLVAKGMLPLTAAHPVLHTLLWTFFVKISSITGIRSLAMIGYVIFQLTIVILVYIYLIKWMEKRGFSKIYIILTYLYFLLTPTLQLFSIIMTKDVLFAFSLLLFLTSILDIYQKQDKKNFIKFFLFGLLSCLFRNNMIYVVLALTLFVLIIDFKKVKIILTLILVILSFFFIDGYVYAKFNIAHDNSGEMLSVPLLQMSKVFDNGTYTKIEQDKIKLYAPNITDYNSRIADYVKWGFHHDYFPKHKKEFLKLYLKGLKENFYSYVTVFLDLNSPSWYFNSALKDNNIHGVYIETNSLYNENIHNKMPGIVKSITKFYDKVGKAEAEIMKLPLFNNYFSLSFNFWLLLITLYLSLNYKVGKDSIIVIVTLLLLFGTYLLGPVSIYRYFYPLYLAIPLYFGYTLNNITKSTKCVDIVKKI